MDNTNTIKKRDKNKDSSVVNEDSKEQTNAVVDTSADIIDIIDTPDVATWNKEVQIKGDAADRARGIAADSRQLQNVFEFARKLAPMRFTNELGRRLHVSNAGIIT